MALPVTFVAGDVLEAAQLNSNFTYLDGKNPGLVCVKAETAFTAASSVTADNVFTASYTNYKIVFNYTTSTTNDVVMKLRVGGVSASTNYNVVRIQSSGSSATVTTSSSQTSLLMARESQTLNAASNIELHRPAQATATTIAINNATVVSGAYTGPLLLAISGNHSTATAYDGVEFLVGAGSMTGTYTIYGYGITV
jgi:hypothetical protein